MSRDTRRPAKWSRERVQSFLEHVHPNLLSALPDLKLEGFHRNDPDRHLILYAPDGETPLSCVEMQIGAHSFFAESEWYLRSWRFKNRSGSFARRQATGQWEMDKVTWQTILDKLKKNYEAALVVWEAHREADALKAEGDQFAAAEIGRPLKGEAYRVRPRIVDGEQVYDVEIYGHWPAATVKAILAALA